MNLDFIEGSRHHDPCGAYQEFDNKQDNNLHDGSIQPWVNDDLSLQESVKAVLTATAATVTTAGGTLLGSTDRDSMMTEVMTPPTATDPMS